MQHLASSIVFFYVLSIRYLLSVEGIRWLENLFLTYASPDGRMTRAALESLLLAAIPPELPKAYALIEDLCLLYILFALYRNIQMA